MGSALDLEDQFGYDDDLAVEGVWVNVTQETRLKIARWNNPRFQQVYREETKPYREQIDSGMAEEDLIEEIGHVVMAKTVLLDWEELYVDGESVGQYTQEKAKELLDNYPDFRDLVMNHARKNEHFQREKEEEDRGNSESS